VASSAVSCNTGAVTLPRALLVVLAFSCIVPPGSTARGAAVRTWLAIGAAVVVVSGALVAFNVGGVRERLQGGSSTPSIQSLAVLPLRNLSGDAAQDYFSEGIDVLQFLVPGCCRRVSRCQMGPHDRR
jgi:hypothetical protein